MTCVACLAGELACLYPSRRTDRLMEEAVCILEGACETAPPLDATAAPPHGKHARQPLTNCDERERERERSRAGKRRRFVTVGDYGRVIWSPEF